MGLTRRTWLKTGIAGGLLLAGAWAFHKPLDRLAKRGLVAQAPLDGALRLVVPALVPVLLAGMLPEAAGERQAAIRQATDGVATAVAALSAATQQEVSELFALLALPPTRIAVARLSVPWPEASEAQVRAFLDGWRGSSLALLQSGYQALHDLVLGAWYADPAHWGVIGYPGPPEVPRPS
ncbi:hypothetical protein [Sphaerotilus microaerophilus]|uniref:Uncharacterized protein n=1 Tax=Sphaerotilus microaerophilus TaxID=2914710 RepID=A0ABN6PLR6_9BURK|nr:hypothetical protein [Sphaerotilus sp. FB-5]BDI05483.1 hypothetical protein CATMQ487_24530 [Sphaerotilus sp. FB-5]